MEELAKKEEEKLRKKDAKHQKAEETMVSTEHWSIVFLVCFIGKKSKNVFRFLSFA